jgi:fatty acyl-CoA reductase
MFKRLVEEKPEMFKKLTVVAGEISEPNLGLNEFDFTYVTERTQIIFHLAASLKLEATLKPNIILNLTATKYVMDVAKQIKNLIIMVHTSTAFCNIDQKVVGEEVYDFPHRPEDLMRCAEWMSEESMARMQKDILLFQPNTYTYTKRLTEILVQEEYKKSNLNVCIVRPSIVTPTFWEPIMGWVDSLNGPPGIGVAIGKGALRTMLVDPSASVEAVPCDMAVNGLIMFAKKLGTTTER